MNDLNTILIEGVVSSDVRFCVTGERTPFCSFTIASVHHKPCMGGGSEKEEGFFDIEAWWSLAEKCRTSVRNGSRVRIVGRLKQDRKGARRLITIAADHIENRGEKTELEAEADKILEGKV